MPVRIFRSSPLIWPRVPIPQLPKVSGVERDFARATNSLTLAAGNARPDREHQIEVGQLRDRYQILRRIIG